MLRVWIVLALVLLIGVVIGVWLSARARRRANTRTLGPDDDAQFLRSINIDPDSLGDQPGDGRDDSPKGPTGSA